MIPVARPCEGRSSRAAGRSSLRLWGRGRSRLGVWAAGLLTVVLGAGCAGLQPQASGDQKRAAEINAELGISYLRQNELGQAQRALERALQFDPNLPMTHLGLASLRQRQGVTDAAIGHYRKALALEPNNAYAQTNLGDLLCRQGETEAGLDLLERAIANPSYSAREVALLNAGLCHRRAGDTERAEARIREALRLDPEYPEALYEMAVLSFEAGRPLQTRAFLSRLRALGISSAGSLFLCHQAEMTLSNHSEAEACARQLQHEFSDSEEAAELQRRERIRG